MTLDFSLCRLPPFAHQEIGVRALLDHPFFFIADEMGAGKTKQVIDAMQFLFIDDVIDRVLVVAPASVRGVWYDQELGELAKHLWLPSTISEFHARQRSWNYGEGGLKWLITNYEFIRSKDRLRQLLPFCTPKTLLVLDESSAVKNHGAQQSKACLELRRACGRVVLLNGTPIANHPGDMFSQGQIMSPAILGMKTYFQFRSHYAVMGGWQQKQVIAWQNIEELQRRFAPYTLRRLTRDCVDLPEALPPVALYVPLDEATWKIYKAMRDEMVAWLSEGSVAVVQQAAVKSMRLAQITSGFLGGIEKPGVEDVAILGPDDEWSLVPSELSMPIATIQEVGREKLDFVIVWTKERLREDPNLKLIVWCRFRSELTRMMNAVRAALPEGIEFAQIHGGQKFKDRAAALRLLDPRTAPPGPVFFGGTYGTGSLGVNLTASHTSLDVSYDFSAWKKLQVDKRIDRPGQVHPTSFFYIVATGPQGQKTIDHHIFKQRTGKIDIANWTCAAWVSALKEE